MLPIHLQFNFVVVLKPNDCSWANITVTDSAENSQAGRHAKFEKHFNFNQSNLEIRKNHTHAFTYHEDQIFGRNTSFKVRFKQILESLINAEDVPVKWWSLIWQMGKFLKSVNYKRH